MSDFKAGFWKKHLLIASIILLTGIIALASVKPELGKPAPGFTLKTLQGETVSLSAETKNYKATLVNFWATWCGPCNQEIPHLVEFYRDYRNKGVQLLAVNCWENDGDWEKVQDFAREKGMAFPILQDRKGDVANAYQVAGIPTTFILDRQGAIRKIIVGSTTRQTIEAAVRPLLAP